LIVKRDLVLSQKNGKGFDVPFILTRAVDFPDIFPDLRNKLLKTNHTDLQLLTKKWISLNDMAMLLGCPLKVGTGFGAIKLYQEKRWDDLEGYCKSDVMITEQVYSKLKELGVIKDG